MGIRSAVWLTSVPFLSWWMLHFSCFLPLGTAVVGSRWRLDKFALGGHFRKWRNHGRGYTPLVFFTCPPGLSLEVDAVEKAVRKVERELNVRVERLDLLRNPETEAVLKSLSSRMTAPFLYNRESLQVYHVAPVADDNKSRSKRDAPPVVDLDRIRAWAKGRFLPPKSEPKLKGSKVSTPKFVVQDEGALEQEELLEDMTLTPLQRKGKQAMKERTAKLGDK